jgi:hypothetical protein
MREGKLFWVCAAIGLVIVAFQSIDRGIDIAASIVIVVVAIPFGFALVWLKKKLGLIK